MDKDRLYTIMNTKKIQNVYYNEEAVWIQNVKDDIATIGFLNGNLEKDVYIEDLYEDNLYN